MTTRAPVAPRSTDPTRPVRTVVSRRALLISGSLIASAVVVRLVTMGLDNPSLAEPFSRCWGTRPDWCG